MHDTLYIMEHFIHVILHNVLFKTFLLVKFNLHLEKKEEQEAKFSL